MQAEGIRKKFLEFFKERGHKIVPSSSLISDDPSVLLTTAGMQQFKKYFTGDADPIRDFGSPRTASVQKSFRTSDINEVGDETHLTFFEMLGNFSFAAPPLGYFKSEAIKWAYEFITQELGLSADRIRISIFGGAQGVPKDKESLRIWREEIGLPEGKIFTAGIEDNFWGPTGAAGPCGPTTEIYVDGLEIWNLVFNEFYFNGSRDELLTGRTDKLERLKTPGVDTGMGLERLLKILQGVDDVFETDVFRPLLEVIQKSAPHLIAGGKRLMRILTDHLRGSIFLVADGVRPANKEAGYVLRRLLRRILAYQIKYDIHADLFPNAVAAVRQKFGDFYPEVKNGEILAVLEEERQKFQRAISRGIRELEGRLADKKITAQEAFYLYETFGMPFELIKELAPPGAVKDLKREEFEAELERHKEVSRIGAEKKFGGHGLIFDTGELKARNDEELKKVIRLHTATHLMQQALRLVLGDEVHQAGSDITAERTRFDFTFPRKLTPEEIRKVEEMVNDIVQKDLPVGFVEMPFEEAKKTGALYFLKEKYPPVVKVYYVGHSLEDAFSKEFCGGPHVSHTLEVGKFRILKEEAVGAGVRRIRATVES